MELIELLPAQFEDVLASALRLDVPYADRIPREFIEEYQSKAKPAAVLILFGYLKNIDSLKGSGPSLLFIRRTESVETHKGQMAFPGGRSEPQDNGDLVKTALRETFEEVGILHENVSVVGQMPSLLTITGYLIQPIVGVLKCSVENAPLVLDPSETAEAVWIPLQTLTDPKTYRQETVSVGPMSYPIHVFPVDQYRIWGATGSMTKNLLDRLVSLS